MRFSIRTVMVLMTAAAVFGLFLRTPAIVAISMGIALPALIAVVGLTSPQHGTSLDPAARPIFLDLVRLWIFLALGMVALLVLGLLNPSLSQDLARWRRGDLGMHYFYVITDLSLEEIGTATRHSKSSLCIAYGFPFFCKAMAVTWFTDRMPLRRTYRFDH